MKFMKTSLKVFILLFTFGIFSSIAFTQTIEPPTNLTYQVADDNDVTLFWDAPVTGGDSTWLHWDDGVNVDGYGFFLTNEIWDAAAKWDPSHITAYDGWYITGMRVYMTSGSADLTIKVWTGPNADLQYTELVSSFNVNAWTDLTLTTPYQIDASTELWAGIEIAQWAGTAPMGIDDGPAIVGYGDKMRYQGTWYDNSTQGFDANWNIQILVASTTKAGVTAELLGYNVYRDGAMLNTSTVVVPTFVDLNLNNGLYDYHVTALYDEGESDTSNHVEVLIDQPVILNSDSLALVDLYNNCNGVNWNYNDLWLVGPVNEWWGVTTEGPRVTGLMLNFNNLTGVIPESFGNLDAMQTLHISNNDITDLPESFYKLDGLHTFWMGTSSLSNLPDSFGYLPSLDQLSLGYNDISTLPESFGNLSSLTWFGMFDGGLDSLPSTFGDLGSLETCFLGSNEIAELPANFGDLSSIKIIDLNNNQLSSLPESFGNMNTLENFSAQENNLSSLPASFGNLESLIVLDLKVNQIDSLPINFGDLDNLESLALSINSLTTFPESFADLDKLTVLSADQNQITHLPENIGDLPSIVIMGLSSNQITTLPESIGSLSTMTELFMVNNELGSLPETIGDLDVIRRLALGKNNLETIPATVGSLNTLLYLDLSENMVSSLPESLGDINMDTVFLFQNQIHEIPASMHDNAYLILWMEDNFLQFGSVEPFVATVGNYYYAPQGMIGEDTLILANPGTTVEYILEVSGENNVYQWFKDGSLLSGQTTNTLLIEDMSLSDDGTYTLEVTNTLATELTLYSHDVVANTSSVGVEENHDVEINIYPNPAHDMIIVETENVENGDMLMIQNMAGQLIHKVTIKEEKQHLNISGWKSGVYMLKLIHRNNISVRKVIKK